MIRRLILHNFMAHKHTEFDLSPGLTAVTGQNNVGKSAIVEALRCLAVNPAMGKSFIRHGAKSARVEVVLDDDTRIIWNRKPTTANYQIHYPGRPEPEDPYRKLGQGKVPDEVLELLRLDPVILDDSKGRKPENLIDVHLGNQREPIFLINQSGTRQAAFFASSTESAHLLAMQKLLKDKVRQHKATEADAQARMLAAEVRLDALAPLPGLALAMEAAQTRLEAIERLEQVLPRLEELLTGIATRSAQTEALRRRIHVLASARTTPELAEVARLRELLQERASAQTSLRRSRARLQTLDSATPAPGLAPIHDLDRIVAHSVALRRTLDLTLRRKTALADVVPPAELAETRRLDQLNRELDATRRALRREAAQAKTLAKLTPPVAPAPTQDLARLLRELADLQTNQRQANKRLQDLQPLAEPPTLHELAPLEQTLRRLQDQRRQRQALEEKVKQRSTALTQAQVDLRQRLEQLGRCPLCGQQFDQSTVDHLTGESHDPAA